jgi:hypothetical protein
MRRFFGAALATLLLAGLGVPARAADDKETKAILDKAIKALGGEDKLGQVKAATWKTKGTISFGGNDNAFTSTTTLQGLDHYRNEFEGEFGGNTVKGVLVIDGDKGWRHIGDDRTALDKDGLANEKRNVLLQAIPMTLLPLRDKGFKVEPAKEDKVDGKPALGLKVTPPEGKEITLYFDRESGLPVKQVAKVVGFMGEEFTQETIFGDYKEFGGIKKATKVESKRDGEKFLEQKITDFKVLDKVEPKTFAEPK